MGYTLQDLEAGIIAANERGDEQAVRALGTEYRKLQTQQGSGAETQAETPHAEEFASVSPETPAVSQPQQEVLTPNEGFLSETARFFGFDPHTDQNGDTVVLKVPDVKSGVGVLDAIGDIIPDPGFSLVKGARDLASGVLNLPGDIKDAVTGSEGAWTVDLPEFRGGTAENIASGVLQYGVPAVGGYNLAAQGLKAALPNAPAIVRGLGGLLAGGATDAAVTDTEDKNLTTLGNVIPGAPTAIQPEDSGLDKRLKVGGEGAAIGGVVDGAMKVGGAVTRPFLRGASAANIENKLAKEMQNSIIVRPGETRDEAIQRITQNIDESVARSADDGFQPTTGTATNDPMLLALEKEASTSPEALGRTQQNRAAIADTVENATNTQGMASPETSIDAIRANRDADIAARQADVSSAQQAVDAADAANLQQGADLAANRGNGPAASQQLDDQLVDLNRDMTKTKSDKFDAIDPNNRVSVSANNAMAGTINNLRQTLPGSTVKRIDKYAKDVLDDLSQAVTFQDMNNLRGTLSGAIEEAKRAGAGDVVQHLTTVKSQYDSVLTQMANTPGSKQAGRRAQKAKDYFADEFAPIQRDGVGGKMAADIRTDPARSNASQTARKYLGSPEGSAQLAETIKRVKDPKAARQAVRDHVFSEIAASGAVRADGTINVSALEKIIETRKSVLKDFPDVLDELNRVRNQAASGVKISDDARQALDNANSNLKMTEAEHKNSAARLMLDGADPVEAVGAALKARNPKRKMAEILDAVGDNEQAQEGVKTAARQWVLRNARGLRETGGEAGQEAISMAKLKNVIKDPKTREALLSSGITETEMKALDGAYSRLQEMARIDQKVTGGSDTATIIAKSSESVRILAASYFGIVKGRGVFRITELLQNITGANPKELTAGAIDNLVLDPEFAKMLLLKDTNAHRAKLKTYLLNNIPGIQGQEEAEDANVSPVSRTDE